MLAYISSLWDTPTKTKAQVQPVWKPAGMVPTASTSGPMHAPSSMPELAAADVPPPSAMSRLRPESGSGSGPGPESGQPTAAADLFQSAQLPRNAKQFKHFTFLCAGVYGDVYRAWDTERGTWVAIKKTRESVLEEGIPAHAMREIDVLRSLRHPAILTAHAVYLDTRHRLCFSMDLMHENLRQYAARVGGDTGAIPTDAVRAILTRVLEALAACHAAGILHRDVKPANILLDKAGEARLGDFGMARHMPLSGRMTPQVVTRWYRAPEILMDHEYGTAVDMWSVGCILSELLTGEPLFPAERDEDQLLIIANVLGNPRSARLTREVQQYVHGSVMFGAGLRASDTNGDALALDLLHSLLQWRPSARLTAAAALKHPFFHPQ